MSEGRQSSNGKTATATPVSRSGNGIMVSQAEIPAHLVAIYEHNATTSPLLCLPAELRNMIWELALGGQRVYIYGRSVEPTDPPEPWLILGSEVLDMRPVSGSAARRKSAFHLLEVSRQIFAETSALAYSLNTFVFQTPMAMRSWAEHLSCYPRLRQAVRSVYVDNDLCYNTYFSTVPLDYSADVGKPEPTNPLFTKMFPGLKTLIIPGIVMRDALETGRVTRGTAQGYSECIERKIREREGARGQILTIVFEDRAVREGEGSSTNRAGRQQAQHESGD